MIQLSVRLSRIVALVAFLLTATMAGTASVAAQETAEIPVNAILCVDETCTDLGDAIPNFTIIALDSTSGEELDRCVTDAAACTLVVPADADVSFDWIPDEVPAGYLFLDIATTGEGVTSLLFVPTEEPVETEDVLVNAVLCTDGGCTDFSDTLVGFTIYALDNTTGDPLDSCVTDAGSQGNVCILEVPVGSDIAFDWIPEDVPAGYLFRDVIVSDGEMGPIVNTLAFAPTAEPTEEPTEAPTEAPTEEPTEAPTEGPTETPGVTPTAEATATGTPQVKVLPSTGSGDSSNVTGLAILASGLIAAAGLMVVSRKLNTR
jgi:LPXTG-motif cell wall-anchored protein